MVKKKTPYRFLLSSRPLDTAEENLATAKFGSVEVEWVRDDLLALLMQPSISHNLYEGEDRSFENWIGMQSAIMDIPLPEQSEIEGQVAEIAKRLKCDVFGYPVSSGMLWMEETRDKLRLLAPFDRVVDDPDERDVIKAHLMSSIPGVPPAAFNLATVYAQELMEGGFSMTHHHGPLKVDEVLAFFPKPECDFILNQATEIETLEGEVIPYEALEPGTKFICPGCKNHKLPAPDGMNIIEHKNGKPGDSGYYCPWCQVLKINNNGLFQLESKPEKLAKGK